MFLLAIASVLLRYPDDGELIERLKRREPDAMSELYDRYGRVAYGVIVRIVRDRAVAEDVLQESFLRIWNRAQSFDAERGVLGPWVLTVCRNQALDYIRSVEGRTWSAMTTAATERPGLFQDIEGDLLDSLQLDRIRGAIDKLNENQRNVIELAYFEGLSQTEMADRMQQPLGTVKTWMRGALKVLREELRAPAMA